MPQKETNKRLQLGDRQFRINQSSRHIQCAVACGGLEAKVTSNRWILFTVSGCAGASAAIFLHWCLDNAGFVDGVGFLKRQAFPINSIWVWASCGFVLGLVGRIIETRIAKSRSDDVRLTRDFAEKIGAIHELSFALPQGARSMPAFAGWISGSNAETQYENGIKISMFDCCLDSEMNSDSVVNRTTVLVSVDGLPAFELLPRTIWRRILQRIGIEGLTFDMSFASEADAKEIRHFTELFQLSLVDTPGLLEILANPNSAELLNHEESLRRLFSPKRMAQFTNYPAYSIQSRPGFLAIWRDNRVLPTKRRLELWNDAMAMRTLIASKQETRLEPTIPGRVGTSVKIQARIFRNMLIGATIGMLVGFLLFVMLIG